MPFVKGTEREKVDEQLNELIAKAKGNAPLVSYAMLRLATGCFPNSIEGHIEAIGTMEETKLTYYRMLMGPQEDTIVFKRWLDRDGAWIPE